MASEQPTNEIQQDMSKKFNIVKATKNEIAAYLEEQTALFIELNNKATNAGREAPFKCPQAAARKYELVPQPQGGYKIVERKTPIDDGDSSEDGLYAMMSRTPSQRTGLDASIHRGKYNDSMRLLGEDMTGIELKEIQGDGSGNGFNG